MKLYFFVFLFNLVNFIKCNLVVISLNNNNWTVTSQNKSITASAEVPGGIYTDLTRANILKEDKLYRFNDIEYRWVSKTGWTYSTEFEVTDKNFLSKNNQFLVFHGIDTLATIYLNGKELGKTDNMFVRYRFDVKDKLTNKNNLTIDFESPISGSIRISSSLPHKSPPDCTPGTYRGECHVNVIRKMQASFAWDWGPAFPSVGIWKDVELESYDNAIIRDVLTNLTYHKEVKSWNVDISVFVETSFNKANTIKAKITSTLAGQNNLVKSDSIVQTYTNINGEVQINSSLVIPNSEVKLWWPNGYGDQPLYELEITVSTGTEICTKKVKLGFRSLELIQKPVDPMDNSKGLSFYFKVNGFPIYAKGSNLIPVDILPENVYNETTIRNLLMSTKEANMNMLRVWGGGVYMSDFFYQLCDELGILIWQDMMFACNTYPTTASFLESVSTEITQNVRRLQHHASIGLWAGNNEMEAATTGHWYAYDNDEMYYSEYETLYYTLMQPIMDKYDSGRPYLTSSPTNGIMTDQSKYHLTDNPYSSIYGDSHNYNYSADLWDYNSAPNTRFCSEYGLQSLPLFSTMEKVSQPDDLRNLSTDFLDSRQHLGGGYNILQSAIGRQFYFDENTPLEYLSYLSQVYQAGGIKIITEKMRRDKGVLRKDGTGFNMGALYWQLNDVWQAPTWSSIDYDGNWKMLHFYVKKFFSPVLISPYYDTETEKIETVLINDMRDPLSDVTIVTESYTWNSSVPYQSYNTTLNLVDRNSLVLIESLPLSQLVDVHKTAEYYIKVSVLNSTTSVSVTEPNYAFLVPIKNSTQYMVDPEITISKVSVEKMSETENKFTIVLNSKYVSLFTWLTISGVSGGKLSDNGFIMLGDKEITFITNDNKVDVEHIKTHLSVMNVQKDKNQRYPIKVPSSDASSAITSHGIQWSILAITSAVIYYGY